ncbi:ferrous iron transport protein B [Candidatus Sumerlaeota bacterium]|nr:ferrous iron transport protein B [Candidatus Sumerlaeota bacterium]
MEDKKLTIALAGNPNSGKTTVFNNLTGSRQHVGNYPGVTVEKKEGFVNYRDYRITVVDLPGTYSLTAHSQDEIVARNFIVGEKSDVVIDIIDSSNLERNLYLAVQIMELGVPLILALNMSDLAEKKGLKINPEKLGALLGVPVVMTIATKNIAMKELLDKAIELYERKHPLERPSIRYGREVEKQLNLLEEAISPYKNITDSYSARWIALKLLEQDAEVIKMAESSPEGQKILKSAETASLYLRRIYGDDPEVVIAERRYGFISGACDEAVKKNFELRHDISDMIDMVLLNRLLGLPIFLVLLWITFKMVFYVSEPFMKALEIVVAAIGQWVGGMLPQGSALQSLIVEGVIGGVGSVLVFLPVIYILYFALAILEDTGYMARAAFLMDKFMHKIGLHGRSFIPMILGFGCSLPGIMATRTIEDENDRLTTLLVVPFMSCGARLPIYILFIGAFFPEEWAGNVLFSIYVVGIIVAIVLGKVFRKYLFKGQTGPFVMELPPYRMPTMKALLIHMAERGGLYLKKAGTIIFAGCVIMWFLSNFPWNPRYAKDYDALIQKAEGNAEVVSKWEREKAMEKMEKSYAGILGRILAPAFRPLGFRDWRLGVGLIGGVFAKEIVVGTLGTLYATGDTEAEGDQSLRKALKRAKRSDGTPYYTPLVAYSVMIFCLLYLPCLATLAVIRKETNSWRWPAFTFFYTISVAWVISFMVYQGGVLLGLG